MYRSLFLNKSTFSLFHHHPFITSLVKELFGKGLRFGSVGLSVCLSVCLFVDNITQNAMNGLG